MNRKGKMMALLTAAVSLVALAPLAAQASKTNSATAGIFETDVDNFMGVTEYSTVEMEKQFGYIGYDSNMLGLGYARKLGGLYLGTYYNGNILNTVDNPQDNISVETEDTIENGEVSSTKKTTTHDFNNSKKSTDNEFNVLLGLAGMGFKLDFYENLEVSNKWDGANNETIEDSADGSKQVTEYTDVSVTTGGITPALSWGMRLPVGSMILKPSARLGFGIDLESTKYTKNEYTEINGQKMPDSGANPNKKTTVDNRTGNFLPFAQLACGFESSGDNGKMTEGSVSYYFNMPIYSNEYENAFGSAEKVSGTVEAEKVETVDSETTLARQNSVNVQADIVESSAMYHSLNAGIRKTREISDRFEYGFGGSMNITLYSSTDESKTVETNKETYVSYDQDPSDDYVAETTETRDQQTEEYSELNVKPSVGAGMKYQAIPGVLSLNGGLGVNLPAFMRAAYTKTVKNVTSSTTTKTMGDGDVEKTTSLDYDTAATYTRNEDQNMSMDWDALSASVTAGLTLNVTPKVAVDAVLGSGGAFTIDATQLTVACTIKQ